MKPYLRDEGLAVISLEENCGRIESSKYTWWGKKNTHGGISTQNSKERAPAFSSLFTV